MSGWKPARRVWRDGTSVDWHALESVHNPDRDRRAAALRQLRAIERDATRPVEDRVTARAQLAVYRRRRRAFLQMRRAERIHHHNLGVMAGCIARATEAHHRRRRR